MELVSLSDATTWHWPLAQNERSDQNTVLFALGVSLTNSRRPLSQHMRLHSLQSCQTPVITPFKKYMNINLNGGTCVPQNISP